MGELKWFTYNSIDFERAIGVNRENVPYMLLYCTKCDNALYTPESEERPNCCGVSMIRDYDYR